MKPFLLVVMLSILILSACANTATSAPDAKPNNKTQTAVIEQPAASTTADIPVPEQSAASTTTDMEPFEITEDFMVLQQGSEKPAFLLITAPSQELGDNHIGLWWETYDRYRDSEFIYQNGFKRMRIGGLYEQGKQKGWPIREDTLALRVDKIITEYAENGITIMLPTQAGSGLQHPMDEFTQDDIDVMLDYVTFLAEHFKGRIAYYEIYNEFGHKEMVHTYINLVEQTTKRIKEIDPEAKVIMGAAPCNCAEGAPGYGEYVQFFVESELVKQMIMKTDFKEIAVDGISWHPLYGVIPEDPYYQEYPDIVREFQESAESRGFAGEYFADEIMWHTVDEPGFPHGPPVSQLIAAKYYTRTIAEHRALGVNVTINTFFQEPELAAIKNINNVMVGAEPTDSIDVSLESSDEVEYLRQYAYTLPDGDVLLAVWANGEAVEEDYGVNSTLTINGFSATEVTGIDVFYGFKQALHADENADNSLIIHDLMVKDYPVFIKLTGVHS